MHSFFEIMITALAVGMGCGSSCGSAASAFLLGYMVTSGEEKKVSFGKLSSFYLGKCITIIFLCMASSSVGYTIIQTDMLLSEERMHKVLPLFMLFVSGMMLWKYLTKTEEACTACSQSCTSLTHGKHAEISAQTFFGMGCAYGATPCAPLLLILGYSVLLSPACAALLGLIFSITSSIVPFLLLLGIGGFLSGKAIVQVGKYQNVLRKSFYSFWVLMTAGMLILG